jgi:hypothetical protein
LHDFIDVGGGGGGTADVVVCRAGLGDVERLEFGSIAGVVVACSGGDVYWIGRAALWERKLVFVAIEIDVLSSVVEVMFEGVNGAYVREAVKFRSVDVMFCGKVRAINGMWVVVIAAARLRSVRRWRSTVVREESLNIDADMFWWAQTGQSIESELEV